MLATFIIGLVTFIISFLLALLIALGTIFKKVGATSFGITPVLFFLFFPCFCLTLELAMFHTAPHVWGIAYLFIAMNAYFLVMQYVFLVGSAIFTKNGIYRLTKFLIWKKHSYDDVIGYVITVIIVGEDIILPHCYHDIMPYGRLIASRMVFGESAWGSPKLISFASGGPSLPPPYGLGLPTQIHR